MAKRAKRRLADDMRASLDELGDFVAGKKTGVTVHRVTPSEADAREARRKLGLPQHELKAVRRALGKGKMAS